MECKKTANLGLYKGKELSAHLGEKLTIRPFNQWSAKKAANLGLYKGKELSAHLGTNLQEDLFII